MLFNKIAAAVLIVGITAMAVGKISGIIIPDQGGAASSEGAATTGPAPDPDPGWPQAMAGADADRGKQVIGKCLACHTVNKGGPNRVGPNLYGVAGRDKGSVSDYAYSAGMKSAKGTWTLKEMYAFLAKPTDVVPGTKMSYVLAKWQQRRDLIAYLASLGDKPVPLPAVKAPEKKEEKKGDQKGDKGGEQKDAKKEGGAKAPEKKPEPKKAEPKKTEEKKPEDKKPEPMKAKDEKKAAPAPAPAPAKEDMKPEPKPENKPAEDKKEEKSE